MNTKVLTLLILLVITPSIWAADTIAIKSVIFKEGIIEVQVSYSLTTVKEADLMVGGNFHGGEGYAMWNKTVRINSTNSEASIRFRPAKWKSPSTAKVYVNISPVERAKQWNPLASDEQSIAEKLEELANQKPDNTPPSPKVSDF